jgi:hypothetical protein
LETRWDSLLGHPDSCPTDGVHLNGYALINDISDQMKSLHWGLRLGIAFVIGLLLSVLVTTLRRRIENSRRKSASALAEIAEALLPTGEPDIPGVNDG